MLLDLLSQIEPDDSWRPSYPDWFPRTVRRTTYLQPTSLIDVINPQQQQAGPSGYLRVGRQIQYLPVVGPLFTGDTIAPTIEWVADQPVPLRRPWRPAPLCAWVPSDTTTGAFAGWLAIYPDHFVRPWRPLSVEVRPVDVVTDLRWSAIYPDRLPRARSLQPDALTPVLTVPAPVTTTPFVAMGTYQRQRGAQWMATLAAGSVTSTTPPVVTLVLEDRILIGQNQSLETPFYPSIGGSTTWS